MSTTSDTSEQRRAPERAPGERRRGPGSPIAWLTAAVAILVVVIVAVGGAAYGRSSTSDPATATITVTGTGTIQGIPDTVSFNVGVHTTRASAAAALAANNARVLLLETRLKASGVPFKDQQTSGLSIYEQTNQSGAITGFTVDDTLNVTVTSTVKGAGRTVTGIKSVTDQESSQPQPPYPFFGALDQATAGVPIRVGQQPVNVQVTVVYTLS